MHASPDFELFVDGDCPLCRREAAFMRRLDRGRGRLRLTDISAPGFDARAVGASRDELMAHIHGRGADGRLVTGMTAFRRAYAAVGLGWLLAPTAWPVLRPAFDTAYRAFARWRLRRACARGACAAS